MSIHNSIQNDAKTPTARAHHIALRVSDLERSVEFFTETLGARWLTDPVPLDDATLQNYFGCPPGGAARYAFIGFDFDQPAFELFEFAEPRVPIELTNQWEEGLMHWCFTVPDVEATLERIEAAGGKLFGDLRKYDDATQLYFRDPDGNLFELVSISLEELVGRTCLRTQAA